MAADTETLYHAILDSLAESGTDYILYGGLAAGLWGEPRFTADVDVVGFLPERRFVDLLRCATRHGFWPDEDLYLQQIQISGWARIPYASAAGNLGREGEDRESDGLERTEKGNVPTRS